MRLYLSWLERGSGLQGFELRISHVVFLGEVVWGVQKLGQRCALNLWKGSGREHGEDKEGSWIRSERPDCDQTAWEDSGLPSLWTESQVDSDGKYYSAITNRHHAAKLGSL